MIDETVNRLPNSGESYTFHGRDIYAYTGARLASGAITFEQVGPEVPADSVIELPVVEAAMEGDCVSGTIDVLDVRFGSLWTNIPRELFSQAGPEAWQPRRGDHLQRYAHAVQKHHGLCAVLCRRQCGRAAALCQQLTAWPWPINQGSFSRRTTSDPGITWRISLRTLDRVFMNELPPRGGSPLAINQRGRGEESS